MSGEALLVLAVAGLLVGGFWELLRRATDVFTVVVQDGRVRVTSGRCPARLRQDLEAVTRRARVTRARFTVVREDGRPVIGRHRGLDAATLQQLRNVLGAWPLARIR